MSRIYLLKLTFFQPRSMGRNCPAPVIYFYFYFYFFLFSVCLGLANPDLKDLFYSSLGLPNPGHNTFFYFKFIDRIAGSGELSLIHI